MIRALRGSDGFTLAELLVVVAVLAFLTGAILTFQQQSQAAYLMGAARVEAQQNARLALDTLMADLRLALPVMPIGFPGQVITAIDANCSTGAPPATGGGTSIGFTAQRPPDADDPVNFHGHAVTYQLNGTNLERTEGGVTEVIMGGVQQLQIWCYDDTGALNSTPNRIREVRLQIRTRTERPAAAGSPGDQRAVAEGRVRFRNI
jgi:prepilin-type N-terminal cleavage/methylation domain-containing protein